MRNLDIEEVCVVVGGVDQKPGGGLGGALDKLGKGELSYEGAKFIISHVLPWLSNRIQDREMRIHLETLADRAAARLGDYSAPSPGPSGPAGSGTYQPPSGDMLPSGIALFENGHIFSPEYIVNEILDNLSRDWQDSTQMER
jgi:hypothetical protein